MLRKRSIPDICQFWYTTGQFSTLTWKKYTTASCDGCDWYQLCYGVLQSLIWPWAWLKGELLQYLRYFSITLYMPYYVFLYFALEITVVIVCGYGDIWGYFPVQMRRIPPGNGGILPAGRFPPTGNKAPLNLTFCRTCLSQLIQNLTLRARFWNLLFFKWPKSYHCLPLSLSILTPVHWTLQVWL